MAINFLKRLELQGFKSFAPKTVLEFPERITAIVGPNGSGKSNVIDALRWVLGEREVKNLRGATLENLIFAGTPKRPAAGFARVGLWFDNRERLFENDAEEVVVARKIDRSGASEFYMNESEMRLRDLVPMLARAKLGARGMNMIGQGQSDVFVKSSPQDRREMIEEILGLREFRLKKTQAERRLATSEVNMDKVQAMLDELSPHLRLLRRQKHRWDKRSDVERELRELENTYFSFRYRKFDGALHGVIAPLDTLTGERNAKEKVVQGLEASLKTINAQGSGEEVAKTIRGELAKILDRRSGAEKTLARLEAKIEFEAVRPTEGADHTLAESLELVRGTLSDLKSVFAQGSLDDVKRVLTPVISKLDAFLKQEKPSVDRSLTEETAKLRTELETLDREVQKLRSAEEAEAKRREELNRAFRDQIEHMDREKNELRRLDREIQEKLLEKERLQLQLNEVLHEWHTLGRTLEELKVLPPVTEPMDAAETERRIMRLRGELIAIGEIDEAIVKEATESEARFEFLSRELDDLTKAVADLKKLIKELEVKIHEDFKGAFKSINEEFNNYFKLMFGGGRAHLKLVMPKPKPVEVEGDAGDGSAVAAGAEPPPGGDGDATQEEQEDPELSAGVEISLNLPRKRITSLEMLSGGEKSLVSLAALFALIAVSPPPFLVLDEIDAALDEENARRFSELVKTFASKAQFIVVTHNRATMECADVLYGVTMGDDGVSKVLSLKLE
jgi:chromosome segregation protein